MWQLHSVLFVLHNVVARKPRLGGYVPIDYHTGVVLQNLICRLNLFHQYVIIVCHNHIRFFNYYSAIQVTFLLLSAKKQTLESIVFDIRHLTKFIENGAYSKGGSIG